MDKIAAICLVSSAVLAGWFHFRARRRLITAMFAGMVVLVGVLIVGALIVAVVHWALDMGPISAVPQWVYQTYLKYGILTALALFWSALIARQA